MRRLALLAVPLVLLAGCGGGDDDTAATPSAAETTTATATASAGSAAGSLSAEEQKCYDAIVTALKDDAATSDEPPAECSGLPQTRSVQLLAQATEDQINALVSESPS